MKKIIYLILNIIIILSQIVAMILVLSQIQGSAFKYFTVLSNMILAISAVLNIIFINKNPKWNQYFCFGATLYTAITFLLVVFYLAPTSSYGFFFMFKSYNFIMHLSNPLLGLVVLYMMKPDLKYLKLYFLLIPIIIYGVLYAFMVFRGYWNDFYTFTFGYKWYYFLLSMVSMGIFIISLLNGMYFLNKLLKGRKKDE